MGQLIDLRAADGHLGEAYVAQPKGPPRAAIVILQEIFGVNKHITAVADGFAMAGFFAIAPATFSRLKNDVHLGYTPADIAQGRALKNQAEALPAPGVLADVQAAVDHASKAAHGLVGVVGYCWGGLLTWRAAEQVSGLNAAVCYYGGGMTLPPELHRQAKCPVLAHFGEQDSLIPMDTVQAFKQAQPGVEVHVYNADHGFNCDHRGAYNAEAADLALERTLGFFIQHLGL
jgi:carboxymethylenebutenolidase